ncbi:MAG: prolyl oligopeptidase family serine peptidase [Actinomycetota bacterium]|nr:prolyl oligopeptidase family serine peptidase [Actinomycetota bacterium]
MIDLPALDFADVAPFVAAVRVTGLALSLDGSRLVASAEQLDDKAARYVSALWELDPHGNAAPTRLTRSAKGESSPAFLPDGSLLFASARSYLPADGDNEADGSRDGSALWMLPTTGEPRAIVRSPGGVTGAVVATGAGSILLAGSRLVDSSDVEDDAVRRLDRQERRVTAIMHTGMPIRDWDHELGDEAGRLLVVITGDDGQWVPRDLAPDSGFALVGAEYSISADGATAAVTWRTPERGGRLRQTIMLLDVASGRRTPLPVEPDSNYVAPVLSPDGKRIAVLHERDTSFTIPLRHSLLILELDSPAAACRLELDDLEPAEWAWSSDARTLFVTGDWHGHRPVVAVDTRTGVLRRLTADGAYSNLCPSPDGRHVYALRSAIDSPPTPVRLDVDTAEQQPRFLPSPGTRVALPGVLSDVEVSTADGVSVRGWLCLPAETSAPPPLMVFIHGGPFMSSNSWSWRWNPWLAVARGYAVLLPDPALSTGYGPKFIERAWPHRAQIVWDDIEVLVDRVAAEHRIDGTRAACLGGSFGGYMTNWVAGHTDRFRAIVTHAGLWALDQQHTTTDNAFWKSSVFGTPSEHPEWYAQNSPHHFIDAIRTPMLVSHGNRDYRVPVSEALRLWWDLVSHFDGEPDQLPHRFLHFTSENHWILSPANARVWYETVLDFCDRHVRSQKPS